MSLIMQDKEDELRILVDNPKMLQTKVNQWRHQYYLEIGEMVHVEGSLYALAIVRRERSDGKVEV